MLLEEQLPSTPSRSRIVLPITNTPSRISKRRKTQTTLDMSLNDTSDADIPTITTPTTSHRIVNMEQHSPSNEFMTVRLSGTVFPDDRGALRDIARQLGVIPDGRGFVRNLLVNTLMIIFDRLKTMLIISHRLPNVYLIY
jgi:hypothetical protein